MEPTAKQAEFLAAVEMGRNVFLTGEAGTGKSYIGREAMDRLKVAGRKVIAVAPTGIAATNIDGQTIHSLFALRPYGILTMEDCHFLKPGTRKVLREAQTIFVDEVSMLRPDILDAMHWTLVKNGLPGLDKKQIIFMGDMCQLPPILDDNERSVLYRTYDADTWEYSKICSRMNILMIELDEVQRQSNPEFIKALNIVRKGEKAKYFRQFIHTEPQGVVLAPHNSTVASYNEAGLAAQAGEMFTYKAQIEGEAKPEDFRLEEVIKVKEGCRIMYLANSENNPLRNGTLGTFHAADGKIFIRVGAIDYAMEKVVMTKKKYVWQKSSDTLELEELGSITQYPFKLAYAISIHKSQGLTLNEVTIDLRRPCFQKQQIYVALSRVRGPEGLRIITK